MAKILIGIALAVMIGTAVLAFMAKGNIDVLQSTLKDTKTSLARTEGTLKKTQGELKETTENLTAANATIEERNKTIAEQKGTMDDLNTKLTAANATIEQKTAEVVAIQTKLDEAIKNAPTGGDGNLAERIAQLNADLQKALTEVAEAKQVQTTLRDQLANEESKVAILERNEKARQANIMRKSLTGRIMAVNEGWNFVVLNIGDRQGAVTNSPMLVTRGGTPIAKVRITSVEASTSIADVIPGSVRPGVTVQPGDTVVYEGRNAVTAPRRPTPAPTDSSVPPLMPR